MGKVLGIEMNGQEAEVLKKIVDLEVKDIDQMILSWNIRGLGRQEKKGKIRKILKARNVDVVFLQETKKSAVAEKEVRTLWARNKMDFLAVDSKGLAGGLLCIWDPECVFGVSCGDHLIKLRREFPNPWCLCGDFNEIKSIGERKGCIRRDKGMREFIDFIDKCEVQDMPLLGRKYTWCNSLAGEKWSRIDRVLVDPQWLEVFNLKLWGLPRLISDHCPLLLMEDDRDWGPKPFRVINAWSLHPSFPAFVEKLKEAEEELHHLDLSAESRDLDNSEKDRRRVIRDQVWRLSRMVEWLWLQKSRLNWNLKGDRNTKFFHVVTKSRQSRNEISSISVENVLYEDPAQVRKAAFDHFRNQFKEDWRSRPKLGGQFKSILDCPGFDSLEVAFSEEEIKAAVKGCDGNKAPGPDGFNLSFFQKFWKFLKSDLLLGDYRPISLVGSVYKVLAKVLASRLKGVLPHIISTAQSAFIGGRNILDGILIANEIVDGWRKSKMRGVIIKLDFEKAFDSVNWCYLSSMVLNFGFGVKWISWIKECISTAKLSVLVNGSPTEEFPPQKGFRQGDPLSPFLFNIAAEGLNILMSRAQQHGLIKGVNVGSSEVLLTHLQFADDSILFCEAEEMEVCNIKRVLRCFEVISGLRINYHKSLVCGVNVPEESLSEFAARLHCQPKTLPLKYLGLPLGANPNKKSTWKPVLDKVRSRLAGWKRKLLSSSGRLTLLKSVSSALPMFYLSLFKMPVGIAREFDKLQANFLWGGSESKKPIHLVKWDDITKNVKQGGLGVRRVRLVNDCMLLKWWWRFGSEKDALWRKIICSKYNLDVNSWSPSSFPSSRLSCVWKGIISIPERRNSLMVFYLNNVHIKVGDGNRTFFWKDIWCSNSSLKDEFPTLHRLDVNKEETLRSIYDRRVHSGAWNFQFRRRLYKWEEREVSRLNLLLASASAPCSVLEDKLVWLVEGSGLFSVSSAYNNKIDSLSPSLISCKFVWNSFAPPKVQFFCWLAWRNRIKSADFLQKIGVIQANAPAACVFCNSEPESSTHLLLHCYFAWKVWADMMDWWELKGAIPGSVEGILHWWAGVSLNRKEKWIWKLLSLSLCAGGMLLSSGLLG
ncbi:uncharacterized protein LOC114319532 [Camellia sinensis]|uniref:uncharacterized protein LOC114319532 n=1 Tax=Camellia sinensis TaxID=4442 RepID=UPI0010366A2A|nr:uncharacterized protein LOC114319532 [Camellia sinensis]